MLIVVISLIIALVTYGWGLHKQQKEEGNLLKFLEKFDTSECALETADMPFEPNMLKPLTLLAKAFENAGEYHKAISIYLYLIKNISQDSGKIELMERLGSTYLHAGFLERSQSIYTEVLRKKPRNIQVLYELGIVYEMMQKYDKAKEILGPLNMLGEETKSLEKFLNFSELLANKTLAIQDKIERLKKILKEEERIKELLDVLWFLPNSQLDLDIITSNKQLQTLYYAKGYLKEPTIRSGIFSLDMLATAKLCQKCKQSFPVSFKRCPNCMAINSVKVEEKIAKSSPKTDYSLL